MKSRLLIPFILVMALIMVYVPESQAGEVPEWTIKEGEDYNKVELYDLESIWEGVAYGSVYPPTTVDMNGGHVGDLDDYDSGMFTYESSTFNMSDGVVEYLHTYNSSTVNISGGVVGADLGCLLNMSAHDSSTVNVYDGALLWGLSYSNFLLFDSAVLNLYGGEVWLFLVPLGSSTINIYDAEIHYDICAEDSSTVNVYGGYIGYFSGNVSIPGTATVNIYGYGFDYDPQAEWRDDLGYWVSKLKGFGCDGTPITYWGLPDPATHPNINLIHDFVPRRGADFSDFAVLARAWRSSPGDDNWNPIYDISDPNDDVIDESDLDVFVEYWLSGVE